MILETEKKIPDFEKELIFEAKNGNLDAFEKLVIHFQTRIFRYLLHFTGNQSNAEDLAQETFILFFRKIHLHDSAKPILTWLISIARNVAISSNRKCKPTPLEPAFFSFLPEKNPNNPEIIAEMKEISNEVHLALQEIPEDSREILIIRYIMDTSLEETAKLLEIPAGTAKSRLFKARNDLRQVFSRND
ncbi:MAG: sigma-70 family RNA polymerase sigma factor [Candidatus Riflebacteria bacterium]|nr:sigma-70 family RNA polymerase sigma factor [Candidatus Riflebacteria bacterium]